MQDIAPELLERLKKEFDKNVSGSKELTRLRDGILDGTYSYSAVNGYAARLGQALKSAMDTALKSDVLPDGKMYYNIAQRVIEPMLRETFADVTDKAAACINRLNDAAGIGIRAIRPEPEEDRIRGVIDSATGADYYDDVKDKVHSSAENLTQHAADQAAKENAEFQARSGLSPKIVRSGGSNCCDWCAALEGTYRYPDEVPKDVYRRHAHCNCTVEFVPDKSRRQDVHSKVWRSSSEQEEAEERKDFSQQQEDGKAPQEREAAAHRDGLEPLSRRYVNSEDQLYKNLENVKPIEGFEDFAMHGPNLEDGEFRAYYETRNGQEIYYTPEELGDIILSDPSYMGGKVRLLSCSTGKTDFAQRVADRIGQEVLAPTEVLWTRPDGELFVTDSKPLAEMWLDGIDVIQTGKWKPFTPGGNDNEKTI